MQGTLVGNKVYLFGGEDAARRPQGDLFVLDLADMEWQSPEATGAHISTLRVRKECTSVCLVSWRGHKGKRGKMEVGI